MYRPTKMIIAFVIVIFRPLISSITYFDFFPFFKKKYFEIEQKKIWKLVHGFLSYAFTQYIAILNCTEYNLHGGTF